MRNCFKVSYSYYFCFILENWVFSIFMDRKIKLMDATKKRNSTCGIPRNKNWFLWNVKPTKKRKFHIPQQKCGIFHKIFHFPHFLVRNSTFLTKKRNIFEIFPKRSKKNIFKIQKLYNKNQFNKQIE